MNKGACWVEFFLKINKRLLDTPEYCAKYTTMQDMLHGNSSSPGLRILEDDCFGLEIFV